VSQDSGPRADGPLARWRRDRDAGELRQDDAQEAIAERLDRLARDLAAYDGAQAKKPGLLARLFGRRSTPPRGIYIHGGVGRGKSMLMDLFYETAPVRAKRRVHFHAFMQETHARLKRWRAASPDERRKAGGSAAADDPIPPAAAEIADAATLLCFDEFHVTDVANAMILGRLFDALLTRGVVVVATSNRHPQKLYENGLNRQLFLPFIDLVMARMDVLALDGPTDYRLQRMRGMQTWLTPVNDETTEALRRDFYRLTDREVDDPDKAPSGEVEVGARRIFVPKACRGVAVFSFKRLCGQPLGAADYLAIARRFHTLILVAVPRMGPEMRNEAKRFTTLIDILYETGVKLIASAETTPDALYVDGAECFEFQRTVSRLMEMQSEDYLRRGHGADDHSSRSASQASAES